MENKENKEIAVAQEEKKSWTPEEVETIRSTVAYGATDSELKMLLSIAGTYSLDPFLKEIWFAKMGSNRGTIITGRDGYLKIANRNANFDGMLSDVVRAGDKFAKQGDNIQHIYGDSNRGPIIGAYAVVYRKDRQHPAYVFAPFSEYNKPGSNIWKQYPSAMILKVAESMALKRAFSISGLVTEEEIGTAQQDQKVLEEAKYDKKERQEQIKHLWQRYLAVCDNQREHAQNAMKKVTGKVNSAKFTNDDIKALFEDILRREQEKMDGKVNNAQETVPETVNTENVDDEGDTIGEVVNHCGTFLPYSVQ